VPSTGLEPVPNGLKVRCSATRATTAEVDAEGIEPSSDGLRVRCPAIRRRIRMRRLSRESRRLRFLGCHYSFVREHPSVGPGGIEPPWSCDARVTAEPVSIAVYDPICCRAVDGIRTRDSDLASRRVTPTLRPHIARTRIPLFDIEFFDIESSCTHTSSPRRESHPNRRLTRALLCLLSYEGKRGPPRNRTSLRSLWRRSDAQHPRPIDGRLPHLCAVRLMLVLNNSSGCKRQKRKRPGTSRCPASRKSLYG
jgi:hypothetical protein